VKLLLKSTSELFVSAGRCDCGLATFVIGFGLRLACLFYFKLVYLVLKFVLWLPFAGAV